MLLAGGDWIDAHTGDTLSIATASSTATVPQSMVPLVSSPFGHGFYGVNSTCDAFVQRLSYNAALKEIELEEASPRVFTECDQAALNVASNGDYLVFQTFLSNSMNRLVAVDPLNMSAEQASGAFAGTETFASALAQSRELYMLSRTADTDESTYYYQYYTADFSPHLHFTIDADWQPTGHLFVTADSQFTLYSYRLEDDPNLFIRRIYNSY